jgi:hypothetical protein
LIRIWQTGKKEERGGLIGERIPVRCALEVINGESPVVGDGDGVADKMQGFVVRSWVSSATSGACCNGGERRPEIDAGSGVDDELDLLWF